MRCRFVTWALLIASVLCLCGATHAEPTSDTPKESSTPILDRLDSLGKRIFGSSKPNDRDRPSGSRSPTKPSASDELAPNRSADRVHVPRSGSVSGASSRRDDAPATRRDSEAFAPRRDLEGPAMRRDGNPGTSRGDSEPLPSRRSLEPSTTRGRLEPLMPRSDPEPLASPSLIERPDGASANARADEPPPVPLRSEPTKTPAAISQPEKTAPPVPGLTPIHERLGMFRQSLFNKPGENSGVAGETNSAPAAAPGNSESAAPEPAARESGLMQGEGDRTPSTPKQLPAQPTGSSLSSPRVGLDNAPPASKETEPPPSPGTAETPQMGTGTAEASAPAETAESGRVAPRSSEPKPSAPPKGAVFSAESAALSVETSGPRTIVVGKEGLYEVVVRNRSAVAADRVVVTIDLPQWTEIAGSDATAGTIVSGQGTAPAGQVRWLLPRLSANRADKLSLRIVPRQSRPFELTAKVDYAPPKSHALIEVQEAKLALKLHGPREVLFGKAEIFRLEVSNAGTADAENVVVGFSSSAPGEKQASATQRFGTLPAGQKKTVAVELTARQDGSLSIAIDARADGGARATLAQEIVVRRAKLKAEAEGPKVLYAGNEATYRIRVANEGNAPASNVNVQAVLPRGAKYVSSLQNGRAADDGKVLWTIPQLGVGADAALAVTCVLSADGSGRLDVQCSADGDAQATASAVTKVETAPNLVLAVEEPSGPVGLDGEAVYQVRVQNRGTASASAVEVMVYFAKNIEPVSAEGTRHRISSGQVVFESLPALAPGQTSTFQIRAKADKVGNHVFRVEVHATSGIRLVREGTTQFYATNSATDPAGLAQPGSRSPVGAEREVRSADRRARPSLQNDLRGPGGTINK